MPFRCASRSIVRFDLCRAVPCGLRPLGSCGLRTLRGRDLRSLRLISLPRVPLLGPGLELPEQSLGRLAGLRLSPVGWFGDSSHFLARLLRGLLRSLLASLLRGVLAGRFLTDRFLAGRRVSYGRRRRLDVGGRLNRRWRLNVGGGLNGRRRLTIVRLRRRHVDRRRRNSDEARQRVCEWVGEAALAPPI